METDFPEMLKLLVAVIVGRRTPLLSSSPLSPDCRQGILRRPIPTQKAVDRLPNRHRAIGESGKGFVIFTGVHLEAPESWRGSMPFATPTSVDLAYAGTVFDAALSGTPLPHF